MYSHKIHFQIVYLNLINFNIVSKDILPFKLITNIYRIILQFYTNNIICRHHFIQFLKIKKLNIRYTNNLNYM